MRIIIAVVPIRKVALTVVLSGVAALFVQIIRVMLRVVGVVVRMIG